MAKKASVNGRMHTLLKRVVAAGLQERFQYRQITPTDPLRMECAFDRLEDEGFVERVIERVGQWFYRLTAKGLAAARAKKLPKEKQFVPPPPAKPRKATQQQAQAREDLRKLRRRGRVEGPRKQGAA